MELPALRKILVPTDGSELSERALSPTVILAQSHGAEVMLLRALEPQIWAGGGFDWSVSPDLYQRLFDQLAEDAKKNGQVLISRLAEHGVKAQSTILNGIAAAVVLEFEDQMKPDLVVIASHGRSGLARFALGSVADRLIREGSAPVLLVRSFTLPVTRLDTALVPLDGSLTAESALPVVEKLARKPLQAVRLLRVVQSPNESYEAERYLQEVAQRLEGRGLQTTMHVEIGEPTETIERAAEDLDLVILATHGRGGLDRFRHGSIAERATRELKVPVLLVRAGVPLESGSAAAT